MNSPKIHSGAISELPSDAAAGEGLRMAPAETPGVILRPDEALDFALRFHRINYLAEAEVLYRRILQVLPDNLDALHFLGLLCHQQDRHKEAIELIRRILELDPQNCDGYNNLGNVLQNIGELPEAESCYRKAISLRPDHAAAYNNLGVVLSVQKRVAEAVESHRRAVELNQDSADYFHNLGNALRRAGEIDESLHSYRKAIVLAPGHVGARRALARTLVGAGRRQEAENVFEEWLRIDPVNQVVLYLKAACLEREAPERAPNAYIEGLFDDMANEFDTRLLEYLDYRAPDLLAEALTAILPPAASTLEVLDAGCGTGLCAHHLRPYARRLTGVDLSASMLHKAAARRLYDDLIKAELTEFLGRRTEAYDVVASADTLCYFGNLEPVFHAAAKALKEGGILAFTLEDAGEEAPDSQLTPNCRYVHTRSYVQLALGAAGLSVCSISPVILRKELGKPVRGHLAVARKQFENYSSSVANMTSRGEK